MTQPSPQLALTRRVSRQPKTLATSLALVYARPCMGDLMSQPSGRSRLTELARRWAHRSPLRMQRVPNRHSRHLHFSRRVWEDHDLMRSDASERSGRSRSSVATGLTTLAASGNLIRNRENYCELPVALSRRVWQNGHLMRSDASERRRRSAAPAMLSAAKPPVHHRSPLTAPCTGRSATPQTQSTSAKAIGAATPPVHHLLSTAHRSPLTAHLNRATAVRSAPVLSAAPAIRVAHTRHASARRTGDPFARKLIPVHTCMRSDVAGARRGTRVRRVCATKLVGHRCALSRGSGSAIAGPPFCQRNL